ncbi:MAG: thioredoxin domain-containing protein [Lachnospiraceae bacterium]|nr:thioredoxin domain-containing protein [Lachnospiraceae bacterium]
MALRISQDNFEEKVLQADKPVLLDFYSDTCIPCKRMAGPLGEVEDAYEEQIYVYKINVNYDEKLAEQYGVMSAPTLVYLENGEEKNRLVGAAGKEQIIKLFEN